MAQLGIAGSGPSGYRGFNASVEAVPNLIHRLEPSFGHSDFFVPENLTKVMTAVWTPFLTVPDSSVSSLNDSNARPAGSSAWSPSLWRYVTLPLKTVLLSLFFIACLFAIASSLRGMPDIWRWNWNSFH